MFNCFNEKCFFQPSSSSLQPIIVEGADPSKVNRLENRLESLQRKQSELVNSEAVKRLRFKNLLLILSFVFKFLLLATALISMYSHLYRQQRSNTWTAII